MNLVSFIIPSYNEQENIIRLSNILTDILRKYKNIEVIIVDNGSTDKTSRILKNHELFKEKKFKLKKIKKNLGYGHGIISGVNLASGNIIAWFHADLQTNPYDVVKIINKNRKILLNQKVLLSGKRINRSIFDSLFTNLMAKLINAVFNVDFNDINGQPKIFNKNFKKYLKDSPLDFSLDLFLLLVGRKNNYKIKQVPINWGQRYKGVAKGGGNIFGKIKLIMRTLNYLVKIKKKFNGNNNS
jgi:glycosyltransferase involved in cell wall biosynthesis